MSEHCMSKENKIIKVSLRYAKINSKKHKLELYSKWKRKKKGGGKEKKRKSKYLISGKTIIWI